LGRSNLLASVWKRHFCVCFPNFEFQTFAWINYQIK
jgi:hypothetical protein